MASITSETALILIDFINEIVDPKGKLAGKGYAAFDDKHGSLSAATAMLARARSKGAAVIHVAVGFSADYKEQPEHSPLFGAAKKFKALQIGEWGTQFHAKVAPAPGEATLVKHRVSAFLGTALETLLRTYGVRTVVIAGCATDVAVQATARDAHDRDFVCVIAGDSCIAANDDDHDQTLRMLAKVASIRASAELFV